MTARPHEKNEDPPAGADSLSEAEWDRVLPIDEDDPEWQAYARKKIRESLDDPRPTIPIDKAFARVDARIAEYKTKRGLGRSPSHKRTPHTPARSLVPPPAPA